MNAMWVVAEYRLYAKQCRNLAARKSNPADKKRLKYEAEVWAKMAALRERVLQRQLLENDRGILSSLIRQLTR